MVIYESNFKYSTPDKICEWISCEFLLLLTLLQPLLEVNQPPYTLINVNLEHNSNIDTISRIGMDERNSKQINFNIHQEELMFLSLLLLNKRIKASTLRIRLPKVGLSDDTKHIKHSLRNIYKQLTPDNIPVGRANKLHNSEKFQNNSINSNSYPPADTTENPINTTSNTLDNINATTSVRISEEHVVPYNIIVDRRNKYHKRLWQSMKRRDLLSFERLIKEFRNSGIEFNCTSYTLIFNGFLMFYKKQSLQQLRAVSPLRCLVHRYTISGSFSYLHNGIHPALIRFLSVFSTINYFSLEINVRLLGNGPPQLYTAHSQLALHHSFLMARLLSHEYQILISYPCTNLPKFMKKL
ncbi:uncharacterized protein TA03085 [Theileria annulata]|uniref:Uncharacterized protein n=1 Tax=Theileria annulata TaxID=5874 RepID=Q4UHF8_THEAN|nr:uncharacterized protein TA03085 [Theileria annulata]CAI73481.1 hypothetical protein TA03085 [Theileria annulata]|eukprot:XP_954158.1 hypothetical protein TA03085 [Theileria annulata]